MQTEIYVYLINLIQHHPQEQNLLVNFLKFVFSVDI